MNALLHGLSIIVATNLSALRRQVKRLQKGSLPILGRELTHNEAQELIAVANGFDNWEAAKAVAFIIRRDRSMPFWSLRGRSDLQQRVLVSLLNTDISLSKNGPLVFLGQCDAAALPAAALFAEEISMRRVPGVIFINSAAASFDDTALGDAFTRLGLSEIVNQFRAVDLRENTRPVVINTGAQVCGESEVSLWHESLLRPVIAIFNRDLPASEALAAKIHVMFYARYVGQRDTYPILYFSDRGRDSMPGFMDHGANTILVSGSEDRNLPMLSEALYSRAKFVTVADGDLICAGRRMPLTIDTPVTC
jgi:hypothetical protein